MDADILKVVRAVDFEALIGLITTNTDQTLPLTTIISGYLRRNKLMDDMIGMPSDDIEKLKMAQVFKMIEDLRPDLVDSHDRSWLKAIMAKD